MNRSIIFDERALHLCRLIWCTIAGAFRSRATLRAEILNPSTPTQVLRRKSATRVTVGSIDRLVFVRRHRLSSKILDALKIFQPEPVIRWHRGGFRAYWRRKSRRPGGRPKTPADIRQLILERSVANSLWGAPRIHGELLKLGIDSGQTTVAKYMGKRRRRRSHGWRTFFRNNADAVASMDMSFPTISFRLLHGLLVLRHSRRELLWPSVTAHPSAEWIARQITEAVGWSEPPRCIIRDRDSAYGDAFIRRLGAIGIRDRPPLAKWMCGSGSSDRSGGAALTTSVSWASGIFVIYSAHTSNITRSPYARIAEERRADAARRPEGRARAAFPDLGRTTSTICPS